jgi:prophage regulatory protein
MTDQSKPAQAIPAGLANFDQLPDSAHVRLPTVRLLCGVAPVTVWRWVKLGNLPAPKKLGPGISAWNVGELRRALAQRAAQ